MRSPGPRSVAGIAVWLLLLGTAPAVVSLRAEAQRATGSVRGLVVDARTGQPLARARVAIGGLPARTATNDDGRFLLADVEAGPRVLEVSLVGFALARRDIEVPAGGSIDLTIPLAEGTGTYTEQIKVTGQLFPREEPGVASQITIGSAELQDLRNLLADDPMRAVQALPGVGGTDDFRSDFSVRASDFRHIGVTLDGVPSSLLVHTVRGTDDTGSLAMINSDILESVALLAGSYPQRYGNRTGAQVDFRTRDGSRDRLQARLAVSAINASLVAEGPIGRARRGSWLVSLRKSYLDWLVREIDPSTTGTFGFVDGHGRAVYDLAPRHTLQLNLVAGRSRFDERDETPGINSLEVGRHRSVMAGAALRTTFGGTAALTQRLSAVFNRFANSNATALPLDRGTERDVSYRADLTATGPRSTLIEAGLHLQALRATGEDYGYDGSGLRVRSSTFASRHARQGGYALARFRPVSVLAVSPGLRVDRWTLTGETLASPWVQAELRLPLALLVAAGTGLYRQAPEIFQVDGPRGGDLRAERAHHVDAGIGQQAGAWRWQAAFFSRAEEDVVWLPESEPRLVAGRVVIPDGSSRYANALSGRVRGVEVSLRRRDVNGLSGWIAYAYAKSAFEDPATGASFPADAEQRHSLNVYATYRLTSRTSVSGRLRAATNLPLAGYYRSDGTRYLVTDVRNAERLPVYSRLDLRGTRTFDVRGGRLTLFVEIINVYNRRNLRVRNNPPVNRRTGEVRNLTEKLFPIVPSAGVLVEF